MRVFVALDVSQEQTAVCVVSADGGIVAEAKVATCPNAITLWLEPWRQSIEKIGMETGPLAVWLWNALTARELPVVCLDARHANGVLKMMPNKTDRHDARGLAQIVRTGWFKTVRIKGHNSYVVRALLTARNALVGIRVRLENEIRGLLKTFGVMFGKRVGGFMRRAEEVIAEDLEVAPELRPIFKTLVSARHAILGRIRELDAQVRAAARRDHTVRLFMTAPGVGPITALAVASVFDDPARFRRSSSAGAYLGLTPRRQNPATSATMADRRRGRPDDPDLPLRGRERYYHAHVRGLPVAGVGHRHRQEDRIEQSSGCPRSQTCSYLARDVADRLALQGADCRVTRRQG